MNIPENLADGLNLAGTGMALVFAALVTFMLILIGLQKLFPGEEMEPEAEEPSEVSEATQATEVNPDEETPEPSAVPAAETPDRIPGSQIAAMAVALYLAMEREERLQPVAALAAEPSTGPTHSHPMTPTPAATPDGRSSWGRIGREALLESQGRRAPTYGHRPQSAYNPRGREGN